MGGEIQSGGKDGGGDTNDPGEFTGEEVCDTADPGVRASGGNEGGGGTEAAFSGNGDEVRD